ncbi:hypothetical protein J4439_03175 [Candidatus Woesearchaeota archaeon]|nr:hypothetical protein [Candidatus Woesearchaeota archaeon]
MPKCIICEEPAAFAIKGRPETYCRECALDSFSDLELLQRLDRTELVSNLARLD